MKLVTFEKDGRSAVGLLNAAGTAVHPVPGCADMQTLIGIWPALDTAAVLRSAALPLERVRLLAPIPRPEQDVICLGINYFDHAKESEAVAGKGVKAPDTFPIYFSKRVNEAVAPAATFSATAIWSPTSTMRQSWPSSSAARRTTSARQTRSTTCSATPF